MRSLLFAHQSAPIVDPSRTRQTTTTTLQYQNRAYTVTMSDRVVVEDPYLMMVRAAAFALQTREPYMGQPPSRIVKDFLIKTPV